MGMTYDQYWYGDPQMVRAFYEAHKMKQEMQNFDAWLHGLYNFEALSIALANAFSEKGTQPENYPNKPHDFSGKEKVDEETEKNYALAYMTNMVRSGKDWGKKAVD